MNPRPLYRWKSFWFGVLVIAFLGWAWVRSTNMPDKLSWWSGRNQWTLLSSGGSFGIVRFDGRIGNIVFLRSAIVFPPAWRYRRDEFGSLLVCSYWVASFAFLIPWSGGLAWRWRRIKRLDATRQEVCK